MHVSTTCTGIACVSRLPPVSFYRSALNVFTRLVIHKVMFDRVTTACALAATAAVVVWYWRRASRHLRERDIAFRQGTHQQQRRLGQSSVYVTVLGQGGAPLGDMYVKLDDATATGALSVAHEAGITLFDTAPWYGVGLSEARFGVALHRVPRDSFSLQTKVGRFLVPDPAGMNGKAVGWIGGFHNRIAFDYTAAGFERQLEDSLQRTGLGRIDSVVIHDLEPTPHRNPATGDTGLATAHAHLAQLRKSGFAALQRLRAAGKISAIGAGLNIDEDGEDPQLKREWNQLYVDALLGLHTGEGGAQPEPNDRGIDFLLVANMHSLVCFEALDSGILTKCGLIAIDDR